MAYTDLGINCSLNPWYTQEHIDTIIWHIKELWIWWVRREFDFFDESKNNSMQDYALTQFHKANITILWVLSGIVPGIIINLIKPSLTYKPIIENLDAFQSYVHNIVIKYQHIIRHRQIRNEQNTLRFRIKKPNVQEYQQLINTIYPIITKTQPKSTIIGWWLFYDPGAKRVPNYNDKYFDKYFQSSVLQNQIDICALHPYTLWCYIGRNTTEQFITTLINNIKEFKKKYGNNHPIRITEFWISDKRTCFNPSQQAQIYYQIYQYTSNNNIPLFLRNITDFRDTRHSRWNPEKYFGLLDHTYKPKKVLYELKQQLEKNT